MKQAPFQDEQALARPRVDMESRADGSFVLRHPEPLQPFARCIGDWLEHWAITKPDGLFLGERDSKGEWRTVTYRQARDRVGRIAQGPSVLNCLPNRLKVGDRELEVRVVVGGYSRGREAALGQDFLCLITGEELDNFDGLSFV
jgi:hypothetical protein